MARDQLKLKPKYNSLQNTLYMIRLAITHKEKKVLVLALLVAMFTVAQNLVNLFISPTILSVIERQAPVTELLTTILFFAGLLMVVSSLLEYIKINTLFGRVSVRCEIINLINKKAATTSYPNRYDEKFRNLLIKSSGAVGSNDAATEAVWDTLTRIVINISCFVIYLMLMSKIDARLILAVIGTTAASYLLSSYLSGYAYRHRDEEATYRKQIDYLDKVSRLEYAKDIRIFGLLPMITELHQKTMKAFSAFHRKAEGVYIWGRIVDLCLVFFRNAFAYAYLIGIVLKNEITVSEFLLYFTAISGFTTWVQGILQEFITLRKQSIDLCTVRECIEYPEAFKFDEGETLELEPAKQYELKLENVSFRYPEAEKDTLTDINLTLQKGEKLAIVGLNGAGKTTLIKLFLGFLEPTRGRVLLDGKDIRDYNRRDYYKMFSAVFQDFSVIAGTVATNVAQTVEGIDMERVKDCLTKAGLLDKVESLKDGLQTNLNREVFEDAVLLSGGETQRLMLARALYKPSAFIVLDEPTAALDPIAESEIYQRYNEMTSGKSSIYISHRLASTRFCDRIILIADGKIAEEGTHEELLQKGGTYTELFEVQSKYYKEGEADNE